MSQILRLQLSFNALFESCFSRDSFERGILFLDGLYDTHGAGMELCESKPRLTLASMAPYGFQWQLENGDMCELRLTLDGTMKVSHGAVERILPATVLDLATLLKQL